MQKRENKELDVAIELFNSELDKLKAEKKAQDGVRKAEREKAAAVQELKEAESNPDLSAEEKEAAKNKWIEADKNLKEIQSGGEPSSGEEDTLEGDNPASTETVGDTEENNEEGEESSSPPEIIDEPDVLGCGVPVEEMQKTVKEDKQADQDADAEPVDAEEPQAGEENTPEEPISEDAEEPQAEKETD